MTKVSITTLLDAGSHFGHQTRRWNPKMKPYIFGSRGDIYIIDLKQTLIGLDKTYTFVSELVKKGGTILFVGTKKQAQEAVADAANRCGMPYVNARWLGGMLTNFVTIRSRVTYMEDLEAMDADGRMELLPKKEQILLRKELLKLQTNLNGIRNMRRTPDAIFIIDTNREAIAIAEARRLSLPIVGTLDTNCNPDDVDFGIPANDDAIRSVALLAEFVADAVIAGGVVPITVNDMVGQPQDALVAVHAAEAGFAPTDEAWDPTFDGAGAQDLVYSPEAEESPFEAQADEEEAPADAEPAYEEAIGTFSPEPAEGTED
jgi:small subunit ribosomal protein S2